MRQLIVNADDFGLTHGVNRAIVELHRAGVLTSTTLMANAGATLDAVELARTVPALGVGCHVVLVDGSPLMAASEVRTLADPKTGNLYRTLGKFLPRVLTGRIRAEEIEAEARAQIAHLQQLGVRLTHVDTHKHTHMFPAVLRPLLRAARACGVHVVRNPFEPEWSVQATPEAPWTRRAEVKLLRRLEPVFRRIVGEEGFRTTDGAVGVLATGTLDTRTVGSLLSALPDGAYELVSHPGYNDADLARAHTRLLASRERELRALISLQDRPSVNLISFAALAAQTEKIC